MRDDALRTAKESMDESKAVMFVRCLGLRSALPQNARQIFVSEKGVSISILASSKRDKFFDVRWMRRPLVGLQECIKS